jgi:cyclin B
MQTQAAINARMRAMTVDWLVEEHQYFKLVPATLYLCVSLIDRYCTCNAVPLSKLQLVGVTALLVACKFEESYHQALDVSNCVNITGYTRGEVLEMQMDMLVFFEYNVSSPTAHPFLERFLCVGGHDLKSKTAFRAAYFSESCLQEHEMLSYKPSLLAAAAVYLAASMDSDSLWTEQMASCSGYSVEQLTPVARLISEHVNLNPVISSRSLHAVRKKFKGHEYMAVAGENPPVL